MWRSFRRFVASAFFPALALFAQVESGRIVGTVTDPNHSAVPNATVAVTNLATNEITTVRTNGQGDYAATPLNPGQYSVSISSAGFQTAKLPNVQVQVNQSARADVELRIGSTSTTVEVTAAAPLLNTEQGSLGTVVTNQEIVNLPLNGRSFYDLAKLTPGAATLPGGGNLLRIRANYIQERPSAECAACRRLFYSMAWTSRTITRAGH